MKTRRAEMAPFRMHPLHPNYVEKALKNVALMNSSGYSGKHLYETTCPYCGQADKLVAVVKVGAKDSISNVALTPYGYSLPGIADDREKEIVVIQCQAEGCGAAIEPQAYLSPGWFYGDKEGVQILPDVD